MAHRHPAQGRRLAGGSSLLELPARLGKDAKKLAVLRYERRHGGQGNVPVVEGKAMSQQEVDARFREAVEAARQEILAGMTLTDYMRRTGTEDDLDEWAGLLAEFGID